MAKVSSFWNDPPVRIRRPPASKQPQPERLGIIRTVPRHCGGWLALSPIEDALRIGVTAATEAQALAKFAESRLAWQRTLGSAPKATSVIGYEWPAPR